MKIVVTGATGFVGVKLIERLQALGDRIVVLARNLAKANRQFPQEFFPNVEVVAYTPLVLGDWAKVISGSDAVINLAGEPLAGVRWTEQRKQEIRDSRVLTTKVWVEAIAQAEIKPKVLIS